MEKIVFFLEQIYRMTHIPIYYTGFKQVESFLICGYPIDENPFITDPALVSNILTKLPNTLIPILETEEDIIYGACHDTMDNIILLGPISNKRLSAPKIKLYTHQHRIKTDSFHIITCTLGEFCAVLASIYFILTGECLEETELLPYMEPHFSDWDKNAMRYIVDPPVESIRFNYSSEINYMKSIKDGNPDEIAPRIKRNFAIFLEDSVGKLAQNSFKQNEYMACTALSVATHAAIEGGLNPFIAYSISDLYLQRLEKCKNVLEIYQLIYEFQIEYAQQVKETREKLSRFSYVEECKNYIVSHLRTRFTVEDIAKELNINRSYLSRQFSKSEGMSIQQYILRKRIDVASNMLKFSEESILTISDYLCFATQSHFGKAFKQQTGMTPQKYRKKNKPIDFSSDCSSVMNDTYTTKI